jgi:hypothetical protein
MSKCAFFDDQQPPNDLPRWATITQISSFLAVPRTTVRDTVRKASASGEPWVKKEDYEDGTSLYLIDTKHETYQAHKQRWQQNQAIRDCFLTVTADWPDLQQSFSAYMHPEENPFPSAAPAPCSSHQSSTDNILHHLPILSHQLYSLGLQIFQNILAEEGQKNSWQWRWGDLHGEGYPSQEVALTVALQSRLNTDEEDGEIQDASLFQTQTQEGSQGPAHQSWLAKLCRRHSSKPD